MVNYIIPPPQVDGTTTALNTNNQIEVKPSTTTQASTLSDITYSTNTTLTSDVYANNVTIDSGVVITTNGFNFYCSGTFTNNGTINTGLANNQGNGTAYTSTPNNGGGNQNSYGGSGGGGIGAGSYFGGSGGSTLAAGGGGTDDFYSSSSGSSTTPPTLTSSLIQNWYYNGIRNYLLGGGGGGGNGSSSSYTGENGGSGAFGLYVQANEIIAGIINAEGVAGVSSPSNTNVDVPPGGGGGGGIIVLAYGSGGYTAGTYNTNGGVGGRGYNSAGSGGNGYVLTFAGTPINLIRFSYSTNSQSIKNRNATYQYFIVDTSLTSPTNIISQNLTPTTTGLIAVRAVAKVHNNTIGDGVAVQLMNGSTELDSDTYTQEGLASNPHYIVLYYEGIYTIGTQQTFSVNFNAITGGTAYCEIQEFTIEEIY